MTLTSTLGSPGIEIREIDNSIRVNSSTATTIFVPGFASQGPVDEVMSVGTISDFETIYGVPTNAAERYFYYTVKAILDGSGAGTQILCSRLPYGEDAGDTVSSAYTMLAYPAIPVIKNNHDIESPMIDSTGYYSFVTDNIVVSTKDYNSILDKTITIKGDKDKSITEVTAQIGDDGEVLKCKTFELISSVLNDDNNTDAKEDDTYTHTYNLVFGGYDLNSNKVTY